MNNAPEVLIVGAGLAGIAAAVNLRKLGVEDFLIIEKAAGAGGTWRFNTYPGCACDVMSLMYSFSFAPNKEWTRTFAGQEEIRSYIEEVFHQYRLAERTFFGTEVARYAYDDGTDRWRVETTDGRVFTPRVVVAGIGALHNPSVPAFEGTDDFAGTIVHPAQWDPSLDLTGKKVVVVGAGSSAVQIVPAIAGIAERVTVVQRTPQWVLPKGDRALTVRERGLYRRFPAAQRVLRYADYWKHEAAILAFMHPKLLSIVRAMAMKHLTAQVPDPQLRAKLIPGYTIGCKRILLADDYYPALMRDDVDLVAHGISRFEKSGVRTTDGELHEADVVVLATGFATDNRLAHEDITGTGGLAIQTAWAGGMTAHLGTTIAGFPNFFLMMGPNSGGGSQSILFVIEAQARYIAECVRLMRSRGATRMEIRADVQQSFNERIHARLARSVWNTGGCDSWFLDRSGANRQAWPGSSARYWWLTRRPRAASFALSRTPAKSTLEV